MKTLITFSGGLDSTYALWKLLTNTSDEVTAIYINTQNIDGAWRIRYDLRAFSGVNNALTNQAAQWLQTNGRSFTLIDQPFDTNYVVRGVGNPNSPQTYITRYAVPRVNAGEYDRLICTSEKENDGWSNGGSIETRRPGSMAARDIFAASATRGSIEFPLIASDYTQATALAEMPAELLAIVNVCQLDDTSYKCMKIHWFQNLLDQGKTQAEIYALWYQNCTAYNNRWFPMKTWLSGDVASDDNTWAALPQWPTSFST
jgi:hypothetical protein